MLFALVACAPSKGALTDVIVPTMPNVVGETLETARADIARKGYRSKIEIEGGGLFADWFNSPWVVREQSPATGEEIIGRPHLIIEVACYTSSRGSEHSEGTDSGGVVANETDPIDPVAIE